jgi:hypothetical protein
VLLLLLLLSVGGNSLDLEVSALFSIEVLHLPFVLFGCFHLKGFAPNFSELIYLFFADLLSLLLHPREALLSLLLSLLVLLILCLVLFLFLFLLALEGYADLVGSFRLLIQFLEFISSLLSVLFLSPELFLCLPPHLGLLHLLNLLPVLALDVALLDLFNQSGRRLETSLFAQSFPLHLLLVVLEALHLHHRVEGFLTLQVVALHGFVFSDLLVSDLEHLGLQNAAVHVFGVVKLFIKHLPSARGYCFHLQAFRKRGLSGHGALKHHDLIAVGFCLFSTISNLLRQVRHSWGLRTLKSSANIVQMLL